MSYLKAIWLRPTFGALVVVAITALWLMGAATTHAASGNVAITPASSEVGVGGTTTVSVDVTAPDGGLSVWIIEIGYNPAVVQVDTSGGNPVCTSPAVPGTTFHGEGCAAKDVPPSGGANDAAVTFGAWVLNVGGVATGWTGTRTVATFTFKAVGAVGESSPLTVNVCADCFLRPNAASETPTETNGLITITPGTSQIWGNSDCSTDLIKARDAQALQKVILEQPLLGPPFSPGPGICPAVNSTVVVNGTPRVWGNWDCSTDGIKARDVQALQKVILEQPLLGPPFSPEPGICPAVNSTVNVS
jgi:hypothetical protein